jgi:hypothetical protein
MWGWRTLRDWRIVECMWYAPLTGGCCISPKLCCPTTTYSVEWAICYYMLWSLFVNPDSCNSPPYIFSTLTFMKANAPQDNVGAIPLLGGVSFHSTLVIRSAIVCKHTLLSLIPRVDRCEAHGRGGFSARCGACVICALYVLANCAIIRVAHIVHSHSSFTR